MVVALDEAAGLNLFAYQSAITAEVERLYPDYEVIEDTLEDDHAMTRDFKGKMPAYFILRYGPLMPVRRGKNFGGPKLDEYYSTVDVMTVASKGNLARSLNAAAVGDLLGFCPDGVAPMNLQDDGGMFAAFVVSSNEARPTRSVVSQRFRYPVNSKKVGETARP